MSDRIDTDDDFDIDEQPWRRPPSHGVLGTTVLLLALGSLLVTSWQAVHRTHHRRRHGRSAPLPERLQTWEGEGGRHDPEPDPAHAAGAQALAGEKTASTT